LKVKECIEDDGEPDTSAPMTESLQLNKRRKKNSAHEHARPKTIDDVEEGGEREVDGRGCDAVSSAADNSAHEHDRQHNDEAGEREV
jgi:hypothetical protein